MAQGRGLLGLPDVVLGQICSQFCPHCVGEDCVGDCESPDGFGGPEYFGALAAMTQVNVRIGRRAQLVRLHVFCDRRDSLPLLARTLIEQPALAAHIFVVRLGNDNTDGKQGCILRQLATAQAVGMLKNLAVPELGADFDLLCAGGEQRLVAQFQQLSTTNTSFSASGAADLSLGEKSQTCVPANAVVATVSHSTTSRDWATLFLSRDCELTVAFQERIAHAQLNAFLLFKLAKNIKSIAVMSEWPLAVFPELKLGSKIKVNNALPAPARVIDPGPLPQVEVLRIGSGTEKPHLTGSGARMIDITKTVGLFSHLPNLRDLEIRGGNNTLSAAQVHACRPNLNNVTVLNLSATSEFAMRDILLCCNPKNLKHFRFTIPPKSERNMSMAGNDIHGERIIDILTQYGVAKTLLTLHIDTSQSALLALGRDSIRREFETAPTLNHLTSLRHLSISADAIYFPSLHPRVLLRDPNTGAEHEGQRLVHFLPRNLESLEITGLYAIHPRDVASLAKETLPGGRFEHLKKVVFKGDPGCAALDERNPYPVPRREDPDDQFSDWDAVEEMSRVTGLETEGEVKRAFAAAGVIYGFDMPELYFDEYVGEWDNEPDA